MNPVGIISSQIRKASIHTVALYVIEQASSWYGTPVEWENYPDLHEQDWLAVLAEVDKLTIHPTPSQVTAAMEFLVGTS